MTQPQPKTTGCRVCGNETERLRRGLCQKHYRRFVRKMEALPDDAAKVFEQRCLEEGWIIDAKPGRKQLDTDPFDVMVAEIKEEFEIDLAPHIAAEKKRQAQEGAVEEAKTAKKRSTKRKAE